MSRLIATAIALAAIAASGSAFAQATTLDALDRNSDGRVSLSEASVNDDVFIAFRKFDVNKDGELSKDEFAAYQKSKAG